MTYLILDTNIVIKDPNILDEWSPNYTLIVPNIINGELDKISSKLGISRQIWEAINRTSSSKFIQTYPDYVAIQDDIHQMNYDPKLSSIDIQLFELTKKLRGEGKDAILVTNDYRLREFSGNNEIPTFSLLQLQNFIRNNTTVNIEKLKEGETISNYLNKRYIRGIIVGITISTLLFLFLNYFDIIRRTIGIWIITLAILLFGVGFFLLRNNFRTPYGIVEFIFGFLIALRVFYLKDFRIFELEIGDEAQILTSIYVMVRGASNVDDGIKGTKHEPLWTKLTKFRFR